MKFTGSTLVQENKNNNILIIIFIYLIKVIYLKLNNKNEYSFIKRLKIEN